MSDNNIYIYLKKHITDDLTKIKLTFISDNFNCLYCNSNINVNNIKVLNYNFCSNICKYSFNKEILPLFNLEYHYNFYLSPLNLIPIKDYNEIKFLLSNYDIQYLFGGFKYIYNNKIHIEFFLSK